MSVARRQYTIMVLAADAADFQARLDGNARFGKGRQTKWSGSFGAAFVDKAGVEWRVASGMLTDAQIARFDALVRASVTLKARETAETLKRGEKVDTSNLTAQGRK